MEQVVVLYDGMKLDEAMEVEYVQGVGIQQQDDADEYVGYQEAMVAVMMTFDMVAMVGYDVEVEMVELMVMVGDDEQKGR